MKSSPSAEIVKSRFEKITLHSPPPELVAFAKQLASDDYVGAQKRKQKRYTVPIELPTIPIDLDLSPVDEPFIAITRNISTGGISLIHTRHISAPYLLIELSDTTGRKTELIVRVVRCRQLKRFFEVAGEFVSRKRVRAK